MNIKLKNEELASISGGNNETYGGTLAAGGISAVTFAGGLAVAGTIAGAAVASPVIIGALAVVGVAAIFQGLWYATK